MNHDEVFGFLVADYNVANKLEQSVKMLYFASKTCEAGASHDSNVDSHQFVVVVVVVVVVVG